MTRKQRLILIGSLCVAVIVALVVYLTLSGVFVQPTQIAETPTKSPSTTQVTPSETPTDTPSATPTDVANETPTDTTTVVPSSLPTSQKASTAPAQPTKPPSSQPPVQPTAPKTTSTTTTSNPPVVPSSSTTTTNVPPPPPPPPTTTKAVAPLVWHLTKCGWDPGLLKGVIIGYYSGEPGKTFTNSFTITVTTPSGNTAGPFVFGPTTNTFGDGTMGVSHGVGGYGPESTYTCTATASYV